MANSFNNFNSIAGNLHNALAQIVKKTAFDGQRNIQAKIRENGQIDTGFMVNSVYTVTADGSSYQGGTNALPEIGGPDSDLEAVIAVGANYAIYQNYGTRYLPARPFFEPGMDKTRTSFEDAISHVESLLNGGNP